MSSGEWITRITALVSFVLWFAVCAGTPRGGDLFADRKSGFIWLVGALLMLVHIAVSFQVHYQWSHDLAVVETARQTRDLTGVDWGGGVWLNYLFALVWITDGVWWVTHPTGHARRSRWLKWGTHGFLAFMLFNATVIFGSTMARFLGIIAFGYLGARLLVAHLTRNNNRNRGNG